MQKKDISSKNAIGGNLQAAEKSLYAQICQEFASNIESEVKDMRDKLTSTFSKLNQELEKRQKEETDALALELKKVEQSAEGAEKEIEKMLEETNNEIEAFRKRKELAMETKVKEFKEARMAAHLKMADFLRQAKASDVKTQIEKTNVEHAAKMTKINEEFHKKSLDEYGSFFAAVRAKVDELKTKNVDISEKFKDLNNLYQNEVKLIKTNVIKKYSRESDSHQPNSSNFKIVCLTDESNLENRFRCKIIRGTIVSQNNCSTVYDATYDNQRCNCMVTLLSKWSPRHKSQFLKNDTRVYSLINQSAQSVPFVKVLALFATDSKLYTIMEPLKRTDTLESYVQFYSTKRIKKSSKSQLKKWTKFSTKELVTIFSQLVDGLSFLNKNYVAHMNLIPENVVVYSEENKYVAILTGLTKAAFFYDTDKEDYLEQPVFDLHEPGIRHLPPECFKEYFVAKGVDAYSLGHLLYTVVEFHSPFDEYRSMTEVVSKKCKSSITLPISSDIQLSQSEMISNLLDKLTDPNEKERMKLESVLEHEFFKEN